MFTLNTLVRPHLLDLIPYESARSLSTGASLQLDANENPFGDGVTNRYPDPYQTKLRKKFAEKIQLKPEQILFGNGSDELIDMLIRVFCEPKTDSLLICPPTFGMYAVSAQINEISVQKIPLTTPYQLDTKNIVQSSAKILFLPYPNAPTGNPFFLEDLEFVLENFKGIVVIDEAYIDFSAEKSWTQRLSEFPNLVVLQTFSKYWALAGCRVGMVMASSEIIEVLSRIKMPYNLNNLSAQAALEKLKNQAKVRDNADIIMSEKNALVSALSQLDFIAKVFPSQTNFLWIKTPHASSIQTFLQDKKITIRAFGEYPEFLRISIGTPEQNQTLLKTLKTFSL